MTCRIFPHFSMKKRILGFDVSSTTIGYCILDWNTTRNNYTFIECNFFQPPKKGDLFERLLRTKKEISAIIEKWQPDFIAIEDIVKFMQGKSGAQTIITLATFNRMIGLIAYEYLGKPPELLSVMAIRHGLKFSKELPKKEEMPAIVARHLKIEFPFKYNKKGGIDIKSYDMADSVAVSLFAAIKLSTLNQDKEHA